MEGITGNPGWRLDITKVPGEIGGAGGGEGEAPKRSGSVRSRLRPQGWSAATVHELSHL